MTIVDELKTLLDEANGSVFWPAAHLYDALNEAQIEMYGKARHTATSATLTLNTDDDIVSIPPTIWVPQYVEYDNKRYWPTTHAKLEQYSRAWRGEAKAQPRWFVLWDAEHFRVWPRADQAYDMTLWGIPWPTEIDASVTDLNEDTDTRHAVLYQAAAKLVEHSYPQLADVWRQESMAAENRAKVNRRNAQSHNIRQMIPGSVLKGAQSGVIRLGRSVNTGLMLE